MTKRMIYTGCMIVALVLIVVFVSKSILKTGKNSGSGDFCSDSQNQTTERNGQKLSEISDASMKNGATNSPTKQKNKKNKKITSPSEAVEVVEAVVRQVIEKSIGSIGYDSTQPPRVVLENDRYVVSFLEWPDPFRYAQTNYSFSGSVDIKTGKFLGLRYLDGGSHLLESDSRATCEKDKENQIKMRNTLHELGNRVKRGGALGDRVKTSMISQEDALLVARRLAIARGRKFDPSRKPKAILVGDVYIVVFWRHPDLMLVGGPTYDSRVGVDAFSGKVTGMEITRYQKNDFNTDN